MSIEILTNLVVMSVGVLISFYIKTINDDIKELREEFKCLRNEMQSKEMAKLQSDNLYLLVNTLKQQIETLEKRFNEK